MTEKTVGFRHRPKVQTSTNTRHE